MGQFQRTNYITIPGFAVTDLGLSGNELICFGLVYGFTQDTETDFSGSLGYVAGALNVTRANAKSILARLVAKGFLVKKDQVISGVKFCHYAISNTVIETVTGCYRNSNTPVIETVPNNTKDITIDIENNKRGTTENLCLFTNSKFAKFEDFAAQFTAPEYQGIDMYYYWQVIMDWSNSGGNKKRDWIATTRNWIRSDAEKNKVHRVQQQRGLSPEAVRYLESVGGLFDEQ